MVADVSGDGVPAALIMAAFRALLRYNAKLFSNPDHLMKLMNEQVAEFMRKRDFISVFYGILDHKSHVFSYCNCGHNPAILWKENKISSLEGGGPSLNLLKDADFKSSNLQLDKDDQILFYTDGVIEVFSKDKNQFGLDRLIDLFEANINRSANKIITEIIESTKSFSSSDFYNDDFTLLVLKRKN